jgi:hypothetical protein
MVVHGIFSAKRCTSSAAIQQMAWLRKVTSRVVV